MNETEWEGSDAFLATLRDVSDRKRAGEEIKKLIKIALRRKRNTQKIHGESGPVAFDDPPCGIIEECSFICYGESPEVRAAMSLAMARHKPERSEN